jgi:hypothetical protein
MSLISKIKSLFEEEIVTVSTVDVKTADGKILRVSDVAVDGTVVEINEEGEVAVEDGTYVLENGVSLVVVAGIITEIIPAETEEAPAETVTEEMSAKRKRFSAKKSSRKFEGEEAEAVEAEGEITVVAEEIVEGAEVIVIDENLEVVEDFTGELEVVVEGVEELVVVEEGVIVSVEEVAAEDTVTEEFMDVALKDGPLAHVVTATEGEIKAGDIMMIDGVEAGPGSYYTTTGMEIVVGDAGVIMEVKEATSEEAAQTADEEVEGVVNNLKNLINQIKELKSQFGELKTNFQTIEKENKELKLEVSKFAAAPSAQPTKVTVDFKKADKEARLNFFAKK